ncbi:MAG TPA: chromosome condensation regulator [Clostridia bacterium]|nr:chromosome condensation regulator [Clostridia bacterium]
MDVTGFWSLLGIVAAIILGSVFYLARNDKDKKIIACILMFIAAAVIIYILANSLSCTLNTATAAEATEVVTDLGTPEPTPERGIIKETRPLQGVIAAGDNFTIALTDEGKVLRIGGDETINVENWGNIIQVTAHDQHALGLNQNGTVVFAGQNFAGEKNVTSWTSIVQVATCFEGSLGLTSKGRIRFAGYDLNETSLCETWTGIKKLFEGEKHIVVLGRKGGVVTSGDNGGGDGRRNTSNLAGVVEGCAANGTTFCVFSDGTVTALGTDYCGEDAVGGWTDIVAICGGEKHTVGLKADGTVVAVGDDQYGQCQVGDWTNIVAICAGQYHTVGLKSDGTLVAIGKNNHHQCDVDGIDLW